MGKITSIILLCLIILFLTVAYIRSFEMDERSKEDCISACEEESDHFVGYEFVERPYDDKDLCLCYYSALEGVRVEAKII